MNFENIELVPAQILSDRYGYWIERAWKMANTPPDHLNNLMGFKLLLLLRSLLNASSELYEDVDFLIDILCGEPS